jgi:TPP-dependent 2-oxoacid decarboxylase
MPNSILLKVMLLWIRNDGICITAAAIVKMGMPDRVAVIGDGGFQMTIQELGTIFRRKYQLKLSYLTMSFRYGASMATVVF